MVQIIQENKIPSSGQRFAEAIAGMSQAAAQGVPEYMKSKQENEFFNRLGLNVEGASSEQRQELLKGHIQKQNKFHEMQNQSLQDAEGYNTIERLFGKDAAEFWRASPVGARTKITEKMLEAKMRGMSFNDLIKAEGLDKELQQDQEPVLKFEEDEDQERKPKLIDFDHGITPKERTTRQNERYNKNLPLYTEASTRLRAHQAINDDLNILEELSPQITTMDKFNINPLTGELLIPGLASPEAQRFVKTINDFTTQAKDSYGARVTNFDLTQFLKRLPTLANSEEGRRQILKQMKTINDINQLHESSVLNSFDEYGGIRYLDFDKAEQVAQKKSEPQLKKLRSEFKNISSDQDRMYKKEIENYRKLVPADHVLVQFNNGDVSYIPKSSLKEFLEDKAGKAL